MTADRAVMPRSADLGAWWRRLTGLNGFITLAIGIVILVWSRATLSVLSVLLGIWLIIAGALNVWRTAVMARDKVVRERVLSGLGGLLFIVAGLLCVFRPYHTLTFLAAILGVSLILVGGMEILSDSRRQAGWQRVSQFLVGGICVVAGIIVLIWPSRTLLTVVRIAGIALIAIGLTQIITAYRSRSAASQ